MIPEHLTPFALVCAVAIGIMAVSLITVLILVVRSRTDAARAPLPDMIFYCMVGIFLVWSMTNHTQNAFEVALLAGLLGLLTTVATARILTKGRR